MIPEGHASIRISFLQRKPSKAAPADPAPLGRLFWQSRGGLPGPCPLEPQVHKFIKCDAPSTLFNASGLKASEMCERHTRNNTFLNYWETVWGPAPAQMTTGRPSGGHPRDLALKNNNSIAKTACNLPPNIFGGPGFPMQVQARIKVLSLDVCFAYAKHQLLTQWDDWLLDMIGFVSVMPTGLNFADQFCPLASILPTNFAHWPQFCPLASILPPNFAHRSFVLFVRGFHKQLNGRSHIALRLIALCL